MATSRLLLVAATLALVFFVGGAQAWKNECPSGYKGCDSYKPGCETCISSDVNNCGDCGKKCNSVSYATTKCVGGYCKYECKAGWANCDSKWDNGCEVDTGKDFKNCGSCGNVCKQVAYAETKCENGKCGTPVCKSGWANCDGKWDNGCEVDTGKDAKNCGSCGNCCKQVANADTKCENGKCGTPVCKSGWGNCDGKWDNGCEKDLTKDVYNCGKCGIKCPCSLKGGEPTCTAGKCGQQCKKGSKYDYMKKCCVPSY
jgi:hypothetical protein